MIACRRCERQGPRKRRQPKRSHEKYLVRTKAITPASRHGWASSYLHVLDENELPGFPDCFSSKYWRKIGHVWFCRSNEKFCTVEQLERICGTARAAIDDVPSYEGYSRNIAEANCNRSEERRVG